MRELAIVAALAALGWGAWTLYQRSTPWARYVELRGPAEGAADDAEPPPASPEVEADTVTTAARWTPPAAAGPYLSAIAAAEARYGIPSNMLARLLWQESRFRPDIIEGRTRSPAGAVGIAQFMPATARQFNLDPLDPIASIDAAGRYLSQLYRRFGTWAQALAAYNWGQGNVARRGLDQAPAETRRYYSSILSDLGLA
ncbi:MAG: transglycosylase SLT domain-containing protein [Burkholderiales bacterium]|jgi:soluble lytic murein transglycosylase-like protein